MPQHDTPNSLWMAGVGHVTPSKQLTRQTTSDVTVIGAGFTGLRAAHKLAEAGKSVVVLDAKDIGFGASGRNGGQVNPILPFNGPEQVRRLVGPTYLQRLTDLSLGSADSLFDFINQHQIKCDARQLGWLRVDHCERAKKESRKNAQAWIKLGAQIEFVDGDALTALTGSSAYQSGILLPRGGAIQPLALAHGIAELARSAGASIFGNSAAIRLIQQPEGWTVETASGSVTSQWVILATNGYTDNLYKRLKASIIPFVSVQIATPQLPQDIIETILPKGQTIADTRRVIIYARREPDYRIVIGSHGNIRNDGSLTGFDWLKNDAERIFPQLKGIDWEYAWGGKIAVTDDRLPHFHEPATGLIAGMGYNGRGVAMSNAMGTVLADRVLGAASEDLPIPVSHIKKIPFRNVQLLGKRTVVWWMQQLDKREL